MEDACVCEEPPPAHTAQAYFRFDEILGAGDEKQIMTLVCACACACARLQVAPRGGASPFQGAADPGEKEQCLSSSLHLSLEAELRAAAVPLCHFQNPEIKRDGEPERENREGQENPEK